MHNSLYAAKCNSPYHARAHPRAHAIGGFVKPMHNLHCAFGAVQTYARLVALMSPIEIAGVVDWANTLPTLVHAWSQVFGSFRAWLLTDARRRGMPLGFTGRP